jgi:hypothetical protein
MWKAPVYRNSYKRRYGTRCFLRPRDKGYPICTKGQIDCKGINAALYYSRMNKDRKVFRKAKTLKRLYCKKLKKQP